MENQQRPLAARIASGAGMGVTLVLIVWSLAVILWTAGRPDSPGTARIAGALLWASTCFWILRKRKSPFPRCLVAIGSLFFVWAFRQIPPDAHLNWTVGHAMATPVEMQGTRFTVKQMRSFRYTNLEDEEDVTPRWVERTFELDKLEGCDFVMVPFQTNDLLAHTMVSFRFQEGPNLVISVEARKEKDEPYSVSRALFRQFELIYILADEEDLVGLRTNLRGDTVYIHPIQADLASIRQFLTDLLQKTDRLSRTPAWYDTLRSNCTTNLLASYERTTKEKVPFDMRLFFPGASDEFLYDQGLLNSAIPFEELRNQNRVPPQPLDTSTPFSESIRPQ